MLLQEEKIHRTLQAFFWKINRLLTKKGNRFFNPPVSLQEQEKVLFGVISENHKPSVSPQNNVAREVVLP